MCSILEASEEYNLSFNVFTDIISAKHKVANSEDTKAGSLKNSRR